MQNRTSDTIFGIFSNVKFHGEKRPKENAPKEKPQLEAEASPSQQKNVQKQLEDSKSQPRKSKEYFLRQYCYTLPHIFYR